MREDVEALTGALRGQQASAWLNYTAEVCDRETALLLMAKAMSPLETDSSANDGSTSSSRTRSARRQGRDDESDLQLLLDILRAFARYTEASNTQPAVKAIREAIFYHWDAPRMPPGGKYSPLLPHSPAARKRKEDGYRDGFVFEHVLPVNVLIRSLLNDLPPDTVSLRARLDETSARVVITKEEDIALNQAGVGSSVPTSGDPWSRYKIAGLDHTQFEPIQSPPD